MRKRWFNLLILTALLLSACSQAGSPGATNAPAAGGEATKKAPTRQVASGPTMQCTVTSSSPTQGATEASMFPPVSKDDWVLGNSKDPKMTIIEYSDYQ